MKIKSSIMATAILVCMSLPVKAEIPEFYTPGPIIGWGATTNGKDVKIIQPMFTFSSKRGSFDDSGTYSALPSGDKNTQYQLALYLSYGLTDDIDIAAQPTFVRNHVETGGAEASSTRIADSPLFLLWSFLKEDGWKPAATFFATAKLPLGKYQNADPDKLGADITGTGSFDHGYGLILRKQLYPVIINADAYYSFPLKTTVDDADTEYGNYLTYDLGLEYILHKNFNLQFELNGFSKKSDTVAGAESPNTRERYIALTPSIGISNRQFQGLIGYQRKISGVNTDATDSLILSVIYNF